MLRPANEGARDVAAEAGAGVLTACRWRRRYRDKDVEGLLKDAARPSRIKPLSAETDRQGRSRDAATAPPGATHWSVRKMAQAPGVSPSAGQRIWTAQTDAILEKAARAKQALESQHERSRAV